MTSLLFLIPLSILLLVVAGIAFFWAANRGQFDDMETPGLVPLMDADISSSAATKAEDKAPRAP